MNSTAVWEIGFPSISFISLNGKVRVEIVRRTNFPAETLSVRRFYCYIRILKRVCRREEKKTAMKKLWNGWIFGIKSPRSTQISLLGVRGTSQALRDYVLKFNLFNFSTI